MPHLHTKYGIPSGHSRSTDEDEFDDDENKPTALDIIKELTQTIKDLVKQNKKLQEENTKLREEHGKR